jgi:exopolyphosphatase/guanosine-5'-triphosphate,3'-diphosphate pyrophosphatase
MFDKVIATIDLGSNSFHMLISSVSETGETKELYRGKSKVQLRSGLKVDNSLSKESQQRALDCLSNFSYSLKHYNAEEVKVVGTYTLRKAQGNIDNFLNEAEKILGTKIEIISGEEEARLIYVGALAGVNVEKKKVLIIDIGGGSTELVIGKGQDLKSLASLEVGCVSIQDQCFADGRLTLANFVCGVQTARKVILEIAGQYKQIGWEACVGSSGTIRSVAGLAKANGWSYGEITREVMEQLARSFLEIRNVKNIHFQGLRADRENILPGGFCVLYALFDVLGIKNMVQSSGALREGMLYELIKPSDRQ